MEYELGRKLDALEYQNSHLANQVESLKEEIKKLTNLNNKLMETLEKAINEEPKEAKNEPNESINSAEDIGTSTLFKRGRGRPRKTEVQGEPIPFSG